VKQQGNTCRFLNAFLILAALWVLAAGVVTVYFQARGNPIDPAVVATLMSPGVGEFGIGALIKWIRDKYDADAAREAAVAAKAEADDLRAELEATQKKLGTALSDIKRAKADRDAAKKEAEQLKQQALPIDEIVRQLQAAQAAKG